MGNEIKENLIKENPKIYLHLNVITSVVALTNKNCVTQIRIRLLYIWLTS